MSVNDTDAQIREEAYRLWEAEGWPVGRADLHWAAAKEIVAIKDSYASTLRRLEDTISDTVEPAIAFENQGEMPTLTDQGEGMAGPSRTAAEDSADILPLTRREEPNGLSAAGRGIDAAVDTDQSKTGC